MSVRIWIGEHIAHRHEQDQVVKVIELLKERYEKSKCWCHVLCSFKMKVKIPREVDMAVIKPGVIFLIELKSVGGSVTGNENNEWWYRDENGQKKIVEGGSHYCKNPFRQVEVNRNVLSVILSDSQRIFPGVIDKYTRDCKCRNLINGVVALAPDLPAGESDNIDIDPRKKIWFYNCRISQVVDGSIHMVQPRSEGEVTEDFALWLIKELKLKEAELVNGLPCLPVEDNVLVIQKGNPNGERHDASDDKVIEDQRSELAGETYVDFCLTETTAKEQTSTIDNLEPKRYRKKRMVRPSQIRIDMVRAFLSYMGGGFRSVRMVEAGFKFETGHHLCDFIGVPALESLERMAEGRHFEWRWIDSKPAELQVRSTNVHIGCVDLKLVKEVFEFVGSATPEDVDFKALSERIGKDRWTVLMAYLISMGRRKES